MRRLVHHGAGHRQQHALDQHRRARSTARSHPAGPQLYVSSISTSRRKVPTACAVISTRSTPGSRPLALPFSLLPIAADTVDMCRSPVRHRALPVRYVGSSPATAPVFVPSARHAKRLAGSVRSAASIVSAPECPPMTSGTVLASDVATGSCCARRALHASLNCVRVALHSVTQHMCTKMRPIRAHCRSAVTAFISGFQWCACIALQWFPPETVCSAA